MNNETKTPHFQLDYLMPEQAQKHVTLNDGLRRLDGLLHLTVQARGLNEPPSDAKNGARFLLGDEPTGAWAAQAGQLALLEDAGWHFFAPRVGWRCWDEAAQELLIYDGANWRALNAGGGATSNTAQQTIIRTDYEVDLEMNTPRVLIPTHVIFLGLTARVVTEIRGTDSWSIGVADSPPRFANSLALHAGLEIRAPADPSLIYWQETELVFTATSSNFNAGQLRLSLFHIDLPVPPADNTSTD